MSTRQPHFVINGTDKLGFYWWTLVDSAGNQIAASAKNYKRRRDCLRGINRLAATFPKAREVYYLP